MTNEKIFILGGMGLLVSILVSKSKSKPVALPPTKPALPTKAVALPPTKPALPTKPATLSPTKLTVTDTTATLLKNFNLIYNSYSPGQVRYFYFFVNSNKKIDNTHPLIISQMDMIAGNGYNDIDMIVKYAGVQCELDKPTIEEYRAIKTGQMTTAQARSRGIYSALSSDAFETINIKPPNPEGCYYVMVINASKVSESKISLKYEDLDSN